MDNFGLRFLLTIPFSFLFFMARGLEGHFGLWSEVTFLFMFAAPSLIVLAAGKRR